MLKLFNTLSRKKETFQPLNPALVGLYTCGPTVYNYAHIGNLRTYIFEDVLKRALAWNGFKIKHVMNTTDVGHLTSDADTGEDKIEKSASEQGKTAWEIADFYTQAFKSDMQKLNLVEPDIWCQATKHIQEQIELIKTLEKKGFTYQTSDGIYFDTSKVSDYGKLAKLDIKGLEEGARIEKNLEKKNPTDFALWKFSPKEQKRQMEWASPWGLGFPGWHIECSAMSMKYLGEQFNLHCGGVDHIPVHHTNEIAQSESATDKKPWVKYWLHGEFLTIKQDRMGKSAGNFITLQTLEDKGFSPLAYRYFTFNAHYRAKLDFDWTALKASRNALHRLYTEMAQLDKPGKINASYLKKFNQTINDDLNLPQALAIVWQLVKDVKVSSSDKRATIIKFDEVLGLDLAQIKKTELTAEQQKLIKQREEARKEKDFTASDEIRQQLQDQGIELEDTEKGTEWRKRDKKF